MKIVEDYAQRKIDEAIKELKSQLLSKDDLLLAKDEEIKKFKRML